MKPHEYENLMYQRILIVGRMIFSELELLIVNWNMPKKTVGSGDGGSK